MADDKKKGWRIARETDPGWGRSDPGRKAKDTDTGCGETTALLLVVTMALSGLAEAFL